MQRVIWSCWFQGRRQAPELVEKCLESWQRRNPAWDFRCLDAESIARYVDLNAHVELRAQTITAASLSDILRLLLLHEFGGVWVDATTFCNVPLDNWLPGAAASGFFAFARPAPDRELASWFLAAEPGNPLIAAWCARAIDYWRGRKRSDDYFWLHHEFGRLCEFNEPARTEWRTSVRISADPAHAIQKIGMDVDFETARSRVDWTTPVFKLTHRYDAARIRPESLAGRLLGLGAEAAVVRARLLVTTLPGLANAAVAMGIPVIVLFSPANAAAAGKMTALRDIVPVFPLDEMTHVDWRGYTADVSARKLRLLDQLFARAERWGRQGPPSLGPIAPPSALPAPETDPRPAPKSRARRLMRRWKRKLGRLRARLGMT